MQKTDKARRGRKPSPEKRAAIIEAARGLFAKHGVDASTTREIAERADTTERTLFKHFGSKDTLVQEVVEEVSISLIREAAFRRVIDEKAFTAIEFAAWHQIFLLDRMHAATGSPDSYKILFSELLRDDAFRGRYGSKWMQSVFAPLESHLKKMQRTGELESRESARALAGSFFALNLGYLLSRFALAPKMGWSNERDAKAIASLFMATCGAKSAVR